MIVEIIRLNLDGNLREDVPKLAAFLILTIFPILPTVVYVGYFQEFIFPADRVLSCIMIIVLCGEVFLTYITLKRFIHVKTVQFYRTCEEYFEHLTEA